MVDDVIDASGEAQAECKVHYECRGSFEYSLQGSWISGAKHCHVSKRNPGDFVFIF